MKKAETIEHRLLQIENTLHTMDKTLALNTQHLEDHMKRTSQIEAELMPVVKFRQQMVGAGKLLGLLAVIATIIAGFVALK